MLLESHDFVAGSEIINAIPFSSTVLAASTYWVVLQSPSATLFPGWFFNGQGLTGPLAYRSGGGVPDTPALAHLAAFRVSGEPLQTPEPSTLALLGAGAAALAFRRRLEKN